MADIYDIPVQRITGEPTSLGEYRGKVLLAVNVASKCGLTPQYEGLEALFRAKAPAGLEVLGFPANNFLGQEPGNEAEIADFCTTTFDVTFPMFGKIDVNGPNRHPLYAFLTGEPTTPDGPGDIRWNFAKFLVDRDGKVVARWAPTTAPASEDVVGALEKAL